MKKFINSEKGMLIVEATFVFPIMFFVLFFLLYTGNAFYLKAKVDGEVAHYALVGASRCADPLLGEIVNNSVVPTGELPSDPYRYLFGRSDVEKEIETKVKASMDNTGFFKGMNPESVNYKVKFNNYILYQTFSVEVSYVIEFPIRFLNNDNIEILRLTSKEEVPVTDVGSFIRNTDMVIDYIEQSEEAQEAIGKIKEAFDAVKKFFKS